MYCIGKWWQIEDLVRVILNFAEAKTAFRSRAVSRTWQLVVEAEKSSFWEAVVTDVLPSCRLPTLLLKKYCPRYSQLRHFSKMSLANQLTLQHVVVFDVSFFPLVWLTNVALSTTVSDIALVIFYVIPDERRCHDVSALHLLGNGLLLESRKTLAEHTWIGRTGRSGCRGDLCIIVKGYQADPVDRKPMQIEPIEFSHLLAQSCERALIIT